MDYLTNYYKNLSEQLQEKLNHLQNLLAEESESNKEELARINRDRREEGKPPFKTLDAALKHYEEEDKRARDKKRKISESKINKLLETSGYVGDDAISREVARERRNMTPEQKRAEMARQLDRINASRIKSGQKPFASMEEYVEHARKENEAFALARQRQTKERIETWANTPEGQAHIAAHTPTPTTNVTPQQY